MANNINNGLRRLSHGLISGEDQNRNDILSPINWKEENSSLNVLPNSSARHGGTIWPGFTIRFRTCRKYLVGGEVSLFPRVIHNTANRLTGKLAHRRAFRLPNMKRMWEQTRRNWNDLA